MIEIPKTTNPNDNNRKIQKKKKSASVQKKEVSFSEELSANIEETYEGSLEADRKSVV